MEKNQNKTYLSWFNAKFFFFAFRSKIQSLKKKQVTYPHFPMMGKLDCCNIHQIAEPYDTQQV